jgi:pimeloyl-ACP methyl ester carboxylesterase
MTDAVRGSIALLFLVSTVRLCAEENPAPLPDLTEIQVVSSLDGEKQSVVYWAPEKARTGSHPMLVFLHSWSANYQQKNDKWQREVVARNWVYLHPDFRGPNSSPKACGSRFARQDILDAMDWATRTFQIDSNRVYLAGTSGGGHMAMLMAGHHADRFSAVSAWVGISDLAKWYSFHTRDGKPGRYAQMVLKSLGGPPGESDVRDADYRDRSPWFHLHKVGDLPIELCAGVRDGHTGSVPIMHSLRAFNVIAKAADTKQISDAEISQLWDNGKLSRPLPFDTRADEAYGRQILLRRTSKRARVTIFDGGHEGFPVPACNWLSQHNRRVQNQR